MISPMLEVAMRYAMRDLLVFPAANKKPLTEHGFKAASLHPEDLNAWWTKDPAAQVALPTGVVNHLFVLDVDSPAAAAYIGKLTLPPTFTVETRPGRFQLWFDQPAGATTKCTSSDLVPGLDTRGDGGYTIGPPSIHHLTGQPYKVIKDLPWAPMPQVLIDLFSATNGREAASSAPDAIPQGRRHATMLKIAGSLRARGLEPSSVLAALIAVNERTCCPPLPTTEIEKLAAYVGTKPAGGRGITMETSASVEIECFRAVQERPVQWLWEKKIALGTLALLVGMPGVGKSLATDKISYHVSRGRPFPDGSPCELGDVIFLAAEDNPETTQKPRLLAAGCDVDRIHRVKSVRVNLADGETGESMFDLDRDIEKLQESLENIPTAKILWIDPVSAYFGRIDTHRDAEIRRVLLPLAQLAARRNIAVGAVMHLKKADATALLRVAGSIGFVAAARIVYGFGELPDGNGKRVMVPIKNNLAPLGDAIEYSIEADANNVPRIIWGAAVNVSADEVLSGDPKDRATGPKQIEAEAWLEAFVCDGDEHFVLDIMEAAEKAGLSRRTVERAKLALGLKQGKRGRRWYWQLG